MSFDEVFNYLQQPQHEVVYVGEGVAGIAINQTTSFHFYTSDAPRMIEDLHSHMRGYTSNVLKGTIRNHIYEIQGLNSQGRLLINTKCPLLCGKGGCAKQTVVQRNLNVVKIKEITTKCGESYTLNYNEFHMFELLTDGPVITNMTYRPAQQLNTQIIVDGDYLTNKCCPIEPSEDQLWEMVRSCLEPENEMELIHFSC